MAVKIHIKIYKTQLDVSFCRDFIKDDQVGGEVFFVGTVRNQTKSKKVLRLEFESYEPMAIKEMNKIANHCFNTWEVVKIAIHHRVGNLVVGEIPVVIAVSAAHRKAAFAACQYCIDTLKETVPIWKKEIFEDGEIWVSATP